MTGYVLCSCCGRRVPASLDDVGKAVVCPITRRLVVVRRQDLVLPEPPPPPVVRAPSNRGRWLAAGAAALVLAGVGGYVAWDQIGRKPVEVAKNPDDGKDKTPPAPEPKPADKPDETKGQPDQAPPNVTPPNVIPPGPEAVAVAPAPRPVVKPVPVPPPNVPTEVAIAPAPRLVNKSVAVAPPKVPDAVEPIPPAPPPPPPLPAGATVTLTPVPISVRADPRGLPVYKLDKRIDLRSSEELEKELLPVREVSLDTPSHPNTSRGLFNLAVQLARTGGAYPGTMSVTKGRPDLAGLPFRFGPEATMSRETAQVMEDRSYRLNAVLWDCDKDRQKLLSAMFGDGGLARRADWATPEAVPGIQEVLPNWRMAVEALRRIDGPAATEALVQRAACDLTAANRAAAVEALKARDKSEVQRLLLEWVRHPWPRAAEHAAEALVALDCTAAVPQLVSILGLPDPTDPFEADDKGQKRKFRRELVRTNFHRNCILCHAASGSDADPLRYSLQDPTRPMQRTGGPDSMVATGMTTYLRREFAADLPVANPGPWPREQQYDFLTAVVEAPADATNGGPDSPHKQAVLWALRELTGKNLGVAVADWEPLRGGTVYEDRWLTLGAGEYFTLLYTPDALQWFYQPDYWTTYVSLSDAERQVLYGWYVRQYGYDYTRYAYLTYLQWLARNWDPRVRAEALRLLGVIQAPGFRFDQFDPAVAALMARNRQGLFRQAGLAVVPAPKVVVAPVGGGTLKLPLADLIKALQDANIETRAAAARTLGGMKDYPDEVCVALAQAALDENPQVRALAAAALAARKWMPGEGARALAEALVKKWDNWENKTQREAFQKNLVTVFNEMRGPKLARARPVLQDAKAGKIPTDVAPETLDKVLQTIR